MRWVGKHAKSGVTLVEVIVSAGLLTLGLIGCYTLSQSFVRMNALAGRVTEATTLAEDAIESLISQRGTNYVTGSDTVNGYTRQWTISSTGTYVKVTVAVGWRDLDAKYHQVSLNSILGR